MLEITGLEDLLQMLYDNYMVDCHIEHFNYAI